MKSLGSNYILQIFLKNIDQALTSQVALRKRIGRNASRSATAVLIY